MSNDLLRKLSVGMSLALIAVVPLILVSLLYGRIQGVTAISTAAIMLLVALLPYLLIISYARHFRHSRRKLVLVFAVGSLLCGIGLLAWGSEAYGYHTAAGETRKYYQGFLAAVFSVFLQFMIMAALATLLRSPYFQEKSIDNGIELAEPPTS